MNVLSNVYKSWVTSILGILLIVLDLALYFFKIPFASHEMTLTEFLVILPIGVGLMLVKDNFLATFLSPKSKS